MSGPDQDHNVYKSAYGGLIAHLQDIIVDDESRKFVVGPLLLGPAHQGLGLSPDVLRIQLRTIEPGGTWSMVHDPSQQSGQARSRRLLCRAAQLIWVNS